MLRRWGPPILILLCGALVAAAQFASGDAALAVALFVVFVATAGVTSPLAFPRSIEAAEAQRRSATDGRAIVYWRPGCPYCVRLRTTLARDARRVHWVDIWRDPEGAAAVRAVADGNETVPTVFHRGESFVNPDPRWLKARLR